MLASSGRWTLRSSFIYSLVSGRDTSKADWKEGVRCLGGKLKVHSGLYKKGRECFKEIVSLMKKLAICRKEGETVTGYNSKEVFSSHSAVALRSHGQKTD